VAEKTRAERMEQHWKNSMSDKLREILRIVSPGNEIEWGKYDYRSLLSHTLMFLAMEYETITGQSVLETFKQLAKDEMNCPGEADQALQVDETLSLE
jgi:hypothetical protein